VADIFDLGDLPSWLQVPEVDTETATRVRRYANGWLMGATRLTEWPDPIPDTLWAWAIELAAIAYYNPAGASREQIDDYLVQYSGERRTEILAAAASMYGGATAPRGSFPEPDWHWETVPTVDPLTI
jgi:hypothetical protein